MIPESESETVGQSCCSLSDVLAVTGRIAGQFGFGHWSTQDEVETPEELLEFEGRREESDGVIVSSFSRITFAAIISIPFVDFIIDDLSIGKDDGEPLICGSMSTTVVTETGGIVALSILEYYYFLTFSKRWKKSRETDQLDDNFLSIIFWKKFQMMMTTKGHFWFRKRERERRLIDL